MSRYAGIAGLCLSAAALIAATVVGGAEGAGAAEDAGSSGPLRDFDSIALLGPDDVVVTHGRDFSVRTEGDAETIARLAIYVRGGELRVERKRGADENWWRNHKGAVVHVTLPRLRRAFVGGSGGMSVDVMDSEAIEAAVAGSGDLHVARVEARDVRLSMAGSGDLSVAGRAGHSAVSIAGSGDVEAGNLSAQHVEVTIAGSGDASVHATGSARVSIMGSGDATVRGTSNCAVRKMGSGDAHCSA